MSSYYEPGAWNAICDVCGFKFKSTELMERWDGARVCSADWEPRHPQELIRAKAENTSVSWTRPEATDTFVILSSPLLTEGISPEELLTEEGIALMTET